MWFNPFRLHKKQKLHPFFWVVALLVAVAAGWIMAPYLSMALLAFVVASLFESYYFWWETKLGRRRTWSSLISVVTLVGGFLLAALVLLNIVLQQVIDLSGNALQVASNGDYSLDHMVSTANYWIRLLPWEIPTIETAEVNRMIATSLGQIGRSVLGNLVAIGNSSLAFGFKVFIFSVFLYVFIPVVKELKQVIFALSPLDDSIDALYYDRVLALLQSLIKGTFVVTVAQSLVGFLILLVMGVDYLGFWLAMMLLVGLIPGGVGLVLVPIGLFLLLFGSFWQGLVIVLWSMLAVGSVDNILRPLLISRKVELRPVWVLLGMFGGVRAFGLVGLLYGPVIMVMLKTTIEVMLGRRK